MVNHKLKHAPGDLHLNQFHGNQRVAQNNQESPADSQRLGGRETGLGGTPDQHMFSAVKSAEDQPCRTSEHMSKSSRYEQGNLAPHLQASHAQGAAAAGGAGAGGVKTPVSDFNHYFGSSRSGPCFDQHGAQQGFGTLMYPATSNHHVEASPNSHEGHQKSQYGAYPGYGAAGYSNPASTQAKCAPVGAMNNAGGFSRFPGQNQHPSGATPTLNQLLTSPGPMMRYYEYSGGKDASSQYGCGSAGWPGQRAHPGAANSAQSATRGQVQIPV